MKNEILVRFHAMNRDWVIINRHTSFQTFVVACGYDDKDGTWAQGYYYEYFEEALEHIKEVVLDVYTYYIED